MPRKQKTIHYLYKTTCLVTGRYYIGMHSTSNLEDGYMGSGQRLRRSIRKHGPENHKKEILEFFENRELLIEAEKRMITSDMLLDVMCMNLMSGGTGGFISVEQQRYRSQCGGKVHTERLKTDPIFYSIFIKRMSDKMRESNNLGKMMSSSRFTNKTHSLETKEKIGKKNSGRGVGKENSQYGTYWVTNGVEEMKVKSNNINIYYANGWKRGRIK
jgi:hypothetical protein